MFRFQDEQGVFQRATGEGQRTAPLLIELSTMMTASRAVETNTETAEDLAYLRSRGTSVGGLRPKCSVIDTDGALSIGKFPSVEDERVVTKGEVLAMQLAKAAGINAPQARLIDSNGIPVTLIRRFDRTVKGDSCTSPPQHYLVWTSQHPQNIPTPKLSMQFYQCEPGASRCDVARISSAATVLLHSQQHLTNSSFFRSRVSLGGVF